MSNIKESQNLCVKLPKNFYQGLVKPVLKVAYPGGEPDQFLIKNSENFKSFEKSHALITISVGQEVHEGEKFLATLDLINTSFGRCTLCVDDTLQRHTLAMAKSDVDGDGLMAYSRKLGDEWLVRNFSAYSQLTIPCEIVRWDKWLNHLSYINSYKNIRNLYENDASVREVFENTSQHFLDRYLPRLEFTMKNISREKAKELSLTYLFEECAALCLWGLEGYDYEVYPGHRNDAMRLIHDKLIRPVYGEFVTAVWVKFKNRKQLRPQVLEISSDLEGR